MGQNIIFQLGGYLLCCRPRVCRPRVRPPPSASRADGGVLDHLPSSKLFSESAASFKCNASPAPGSYLRLIDFCITQLKAQGPSRTCHESKEEKPLATPSAGDSCDTECAPQNPPLKAGDLSREVDSQL